MKKYCTFVSIAGMVTACALSTFAERSTITFETVPGAIPFEGLVVSNQFLQSHGVSFRFADGTYPRLAQVGAPATAFLAGDVDREDRPADGQQVGQFFLTDDGVIGTSPSPLTIAYANPVASARGVLLDIDQEERWTVTAHDVFTNQIGILTFNDGDAGTGDGIATPWAFDHAETNIYFIRLSVTDPSGGTGLAIDNFSPANARDPQDIDLGIMTAVEIWWNSVPGLSYQVQYTTGLVPTNWINIGGQIQAASNTTYLLDSIRGSGKKFYRVVPGD